MQYRLLRNNIEYGPFSKDDLLLQGLKTTDQIKIVGENSWRAVSSYADFKTLLEPISKPKYKFTADKQLVEIKNEDKSVANSKVINPDEPATPSPFKRTPSAIPKKKIPASGPQQPSSTTGVPSTDPDKGVNRKENRSEPNQPYIKPSTVHHIEHAPKFEQHRNITPKTVKNKQAVSNSNFTKEFILPIFIIGGIGCLIWWGYTKYSSNGGTINSGDTVAQAAVMDSATHNNPVITKDKDSSVKKGTGTTTNIAKSGTPSSGRSDSLRKAERQHRIQDSLAAIRQKAAGQVAPAVKDSPNATDKEVAKADIVKKTEPVAQAPKQVPEQKPAESKPTAPKVTAASNKPAAKKASSIGDYVNMSLNKTPDNGIRNVKINVQNISKEDLNIAVIEVKYYDATGTFIKGETLQTGKIAAGKSVSLKVPNSKDASRISYKASLISGDNVYLMGK